MAAVNLPDNPANGTTQTVGGITYTYNSSKGYWTAAASSGGGGGGGASVTTDDSAPGSPSDGDLWYDTDDGGMFVYYQDTDSSQWVEVIGSQGSPGPAGAAGADGGAGVASVYATVDALPTSGNSQGDMAHVTANNTLYFWNGSGWYKIALINTNPSISGVNSSYTLAVDGTATTVTITATDPEGLPITYSIASDTSGNTATVSQGTGSNTNVFTITPSTNTAYAGSFTLTFRASDGVNVATAPATFTLQFAVQNQKYTIALLTSVGANNATNTSFDDKSTSDHTITANGDVHQTTFSPYRHGGYSMEFDGSNTSLSLSPHADFAFNTGDFTIEWWCKLPDQNNTMFIDWRQGASGYGNLHIGTGGYGGSLSGAVRFVGDGPTITSTSVVDDGEWHHVAICRASGTTKMYIDGTEEGSAADTTSYDRQGLRIGNNSYASGGNHLNGLMADLRLVKGTAVYTAAFTPPTERLTAITNTSLLTGHLPYIADGSTNGHTITANGNTSTEPSGPYDTLGYSVASNGGSGHFDANGDFLDLAATADFGFGTGDFTVEGWYYLDSISNYPTVWDFRNGNGAFPYIYLRQDQSNRMEYFVSSAAKANGSISFPIKQWVHYAFVRQSGTTKGYLNGKQDFSVSDTVDFGTSNKLRLGAANGAVNYLLDGNISDFRVVKGTAVYTAEFTPPTAPLTAITNTKLLVQSTDAGIIDKSQSVQTLTLNGDVKSSTTQTKYLTSSMYFDGTGDYLQIPFDKKFELGTGDFTVEMWVRFSSVGSYMPLVALGAAANGASPVFHTGYSAHWFNNILWFYQFIGGSSTKSQQSWTPNADQWYHVAFSRSGTSLKTFIDGTQIGSTYTSNEDYSAGTQGSQDLYIGRWGVGNPPTYYTLNGYVSDLRITKGLARYTSNFTPPTAALQG